MLRRSEMAVGFKINNIICEVGSASFLHSFFSTITGRLERDSQRGSKFADGVLSGKITELTVVAFATRGAAKAIDGPGAPKVEGEAPPKRIFTSTDPHVAETATRLDELFPGRVIGINQDLPANVRGGYREVDIVMDKFIIQVKGDRGNTLKRQMADTERTLINDNRTVVGYAPDNYSKHAWRGAAEEGYPIARSFDELVSLIKELDGQ